MGVSDSPYDAWEYNRTIWLGQFFSPEIYPSMYLLSIGKEPSILDDQQANLLNTRADMYEQTVALYDWLCVSTMAAGYTPFTQRFIAMFGEIVKFLVTERVAKLAGITTFRQDRKGFAAQLLIASTFEEGDDDDEEEDGEEVENPFA